MIAIGSDHGGYKLKEEIKKYLDEKEIKVLNNMTFIVINLFFLK